MGVELIKRMREIIKQYKNQRKLKKKIKETSVKREEHQVQDTKAAGDWEVISWIRRRSLWQTPHASELAVLTN